MRKCVAFLLMLWAQLLFSQVDDGRYLLVNLPAFEVSLFDAGCCVKSWPVIIGAPKSPTPEFSCSVRGILLNPWWEDIPPHILAEGIGKLMREQPEKARELGYLCEDGRYLQRPGPHNALGVFRLITDSGSSVTLHDTNQKQLFNEQSRAFSHGCVRVKDPADFVAHLLLLDRGLTHRETLALIESGVTQTIPLIRALELRIIYQTNERYPDVYARSNSL